jgi:hypothetical protein
LGLPSQSCCARQLPQRGSQGGDDHCGGVALSVPLRETAPPKGEPRGGRPLRRGCPLSLAARDSSPKGGAKGGTTAAAGLPSQSRCAGQLPQRGSQGGDDRCGGVALSVSLRGTAPPKGEPRGDDRCGGVALSVPLRETAPPKGEPRGTAGTRRLTSPFGRDVLMKDCKKASRP